MFVSKTLKELSITLCKELQRVCRFENFGIRPYECRRPQSQQMQSGHLGVALGVPCVICFGEDGVLKTLHCGFKAHLWLSCNGKTRDVSDDLHPLNEGLLTTVARSFLHLN